MSESLASFAGSLEESTSRIDKGCKEKLGKVGIRNEAIEVIEGIEKASKNKLAKSQKKQEKATQNAEKMERTEKTEKTENAEANGEVVEMSAGKGKINEACDSHDNSQRTKL